MIDYPLYPSPLHLPNKAKKSLLFRSKWTSMVHCTHQCTIHCMPIIIQLWQWFFRLGKKKLLISLWESPLIPNCIQIYEKNFKENRRIISKPSWKLDPMDLFKMLYVPNTGSYTCSVFCLFPSDPCKKPLHGGIAACLLMEIHCSNKAPTIYTHKLPRGLHIEGHRHERREQHQAREKQYPQSTPSIGCSLQTQL